MRMKRLLARRPHRHIWHLDMTNKCIVCKTCGAPSDLADSQANPTTMPGR